MAWDDWQRGDAQEFARTPVLTGRRVRLEPLGDHHAPALAALIDRHRLHESWVTRIPEPESVGQDIARLRSEQAALRRAPWAVVDTACDEPVGMTTYLHLRSEDLRLEIGSTWLAPAARGTGINAEAKLLLLTRAFEDLGCVAVELRTHWHNRVSRRAIEALGAKQDGVLRRHDLWCDGTVRDVVVYSITDAEWPSVRLELTHRLGRRPQV